jgi:hypothetical protein
MPPDDRCCQPDVRPATLSVQTPCPPSTRCSLVADRPPVTCKQCHSAHLHTHVELAPTTEVNFGVEVHPPVATFDQPGPGQDLYETSVRVQESQIRFRSWIPLTALVLTTLMSTPAEAMVRLVGTDCTQPGSAAAASCQTPATSASSNPTSGDAAPPPDTPNTRSPAAQPPAAAPSDPASDGQAPVNAPSTAPRPTASPDASEANPSPVPAPSSVNVGPPPVSTEPFPAASSRLLITA